MHEFQSQTSVRSDRGWGGGEFRAPQTLPLDPPLLLNFTVHCLICNHQRQKSLFDPGKFGRVVGWGYKVSKSSFGQFANTLKEICIPTISNNVCKAAFKDEGYTVTPQMLCAGEASGGKDSCQGDSGGGFVFQDPVVKKWVLGGVVSWGSNFGCGLRNKYGVYVRITEFLPWIKKQMF